MLSLLGTEGIINNNPRIEGPIIHIDKHCKQYVDMVTNTED